MSGEVRQALADAASGVDGVQVTPYFRASSGVGQGYVQRSRTEYPNRLGGVTTWQVLVVLPRDIALAEKWLDEKCAPLRAALAAELEVRSVTPSALRLDSGDLPAVVIEGLREEY